MQQPLPYVDPQYPGPFHGGHTARYQGHQRHRAVSHRVQPQHGPVWVPDGYSLSQGAVTLQDLRGPPLMHQSEIYKSSNEKIKAGLAIRTGAYPDRPASSAWKLRQAFPNEINLMNLRRGLGHTETAGTPLSNRTPNNPQGMSQGRKNPTKRTSDDARIVSNTSSSLTMQTEKSCAALGSATNTDPMKFMPRPNATQAVSPRNMSCGAGHRWVNQNYPLQDRRQEYQPVTGLSDQALREIDASVSVNFPQRFVSNPFVSDMRGLLPRESESPSTHLTASPQHLQQQAPSITELKTNENTDPKLPQQYASQQKDLRISSPAEAPPQHPLIEPVKLVGSQVEETQPGKTPFAQTVSALATHPANVPLLQRTGQGDLSEDLDYSQLWVGNLPRDMTQEQIEQMRHDFERLPGIMEMSQVVTSKKYINQYRFIFLKYVTAQALDSNIAANFASYEGF